MASKERFPQTPSEKDDKKTFSDKHSMTRNNIILLSWKGVWGKPFFGIQRMVSPRELPVI